MTTPPTSHLREEDYVSSESEEDEAALGRFDSTFGHKNVSSHRGTSVLEKELEFQLKKRNLIIDELRKSYLRDVVAVKYIMNEVLSDPERRMVLDSLRENVPSVDLKEPLLMRSPYHGELTIKPCKRCGGSLEVIFSDVQKVKDLQSKVDALMNRNELMRLMVATLEAKIEKANSDAAEESKSHSEEKKYLYNEIRRLKAEMEESAEKSRRIAEANKKMREENLKHISNHQDLTIRSLANEKALERALDVNAEMKQTIADLRVEIHAFETGNMDLEAKIVTLKDRLRMKDDDIFKRNSMIEELQRDIAELKVQIEKQREFSKNAENAADIADRAKQSLSEENRKLQVIIEKQLQVNEVLEDKVMSLREELRDTIADLDASRTILSTVQIERDVQKTLVEEVQRRLEQKDSDLTRLALQYKELERQKAEEISRMNVLFTEREADFQSKEEIYSSGLSLDDSGVYDEEEVSDRHVGMGNASQLQTFGGGDVPTEFFLGNQTSEYDNADSLPHGRKESGPNSKSSHGTSDSSKPEQRSSQPSSLAHTDRAQVESKRPTKGKMHDVVISGSDNEQIDVDQSIDASHPKGRSRQVYVDTSEKITANDENHFFASNPPSPSPSPKKRYTPATRKSIIRTQDKKPYRKMEHVLHFTHFTSHKAFFVLGRSVRTNQSRFKRGDLTAGIDPPCSY